MHSVMSRLKPRPTRTRSNSPVRMGHDVWASPARRTGAVGFASYCGEGLAVSFLVAKDWAAERASAAGTFTSGVTPVPSQLV